MSSSSTAGVYIVLEIGDAADEGAALQVFRDVGGWLSGQYEHRLIDETSTNGLVPSSFVFCADGKEAYEQIPSELSALLGELPRGVTLEYFEASTRQHVDMKDVEIRHFKDEAEAEPRVFGPPSRPCVELIHRPTGLKVRSKKSLDDLGEAKRFLSALLSSRQLDA